MNKKIQSFLALFLLILSLIVTIPLVNAQDGATPNNKIDGVPVVLDGEKLFVVYQGVGSFTSAFLRVLWLPTYR
jgi:hypothetical protein